MMKKFLSFSIIFVLSLVFYQLAFTQTASAQMPPPGGPPPGGGGGTRRGGAREVAGGVVRVS